MASASDDPCAGKVCTKATRLPSGFVVPKGALTQFSPFVLNRLEHNWKNVRTTTSAHVLLVLRHQTAFSHLCRSVCSLWRLSPSGSTRFRSPRSTTTPCSMPGRVCVSASASLMSRRSHCSSRCACVLFCAGVACSPSTCVRAAAAAVSLPSGGAEPRGAVRALDHAAAAGRPAHGRRASGPVNVEPGVVNCDISFSNVPGTSTRACTTSADPLVEERALSTSNSLRGVQLEPSSMHQQHCKQGMQ